MDISQMLCKWILLPTIFLSSVNVLVAHANDCQELFNDTYSRVERQEQKQFFRFNALRQEFVTDLMSTSKLDEEKTTIVFERELELFDVKQWMTSFFEQEKIVAKSLHKMKGENKEFYCRKRRLDSYIKTIRSRVRERLDLFESNLSRRLSLYNPKKNTGLAIIAAEFAPRIGELSFRQNSVRAKQVNFPIYERPRLFTVIRLKEGKYSWVQIRRKKNMSFEKKRSKQMTTYDIEDKNLQFQVEADKLNFVGGILADAYADEAYVETIDKTAYNIRDLMHFYPYISDEYEWVNTINPSDHFIQFYREHMSINNNIVRQ